MADSPTLMAEFHHREAQIARLEKELAQAHASAAAWKAAYQLEKEQVMGGKAFLEAKDARIAELEGALRKLVSVLGPDARSGALDKARAVLEEGE